MDKALISRKRNLSSFTKVAAMASKGALEESQKRRKLNSSSSEKKLTSEKGSKTIVPTRVIVWLRNDLRVSDNYCLNWAKEMVKKKEKVEVIPLFCFDPRYFHKDSSESKFQTRRTGVFRTNFQIETVAELRKDLEDLGSRLYLSKDCPENVIPELVSPAAENFVVFSEEICSEELAIEKAISQALKKAKIGFQMVPVWGSTLYHKDDLPFDPKTQLPHIYGRFRDKTSSVRVRPLLYPLKKGDLPLPDDKKNKVLEGCSSYLPSIHDKDFGFTKEDLDLVLNPSEKRSYPFKGGESNGRKRLIEYAEDALRFYASMRNGLKGADFSSKLSPWLANGSLSIREVYYEVKKAKVNDSITTFIDELYWRDFYRFWCLRYGTKVFSEYGIYDREYYDWKTDMEVVNKWRQGKTGVPLIDALMRELNTTGFMSNRGRMITACYLTMDLKQDWRYGAYHFEEKLIDHDVHSNYGGWNFSSGIGPGRVLVFNTLKQSRDFDKKGEFIKQWCPELEDVPLSYIHDPWNLPDTLAETCGIDIGKDYPKPIPCEKYTGDKANNKKRK